MNRFLVKRSSDYANNSTFDYNLSNEWLADARINSKPIYTDDIKEGDILFIAESNYAIIGKALVREKIEKVFISIDDFVDYCLYQSRTAADLFWYNKIEAYFKKRNDFKKIVVREVSYYKAEVFDVPYILEEDFLGQNTWYKIKEDFELENYKSDNKLSTVIPNKFRKKIYHKYQAVIDEYAVDIDHHVPQSIGGPGNIEENLVPLGATLNRSKSNHVPSKLFDFAARYSIDLPTEVEVERGNYIGNAKLRKIAEQIVNEINSENFETAKSIYNEIRLAHHPNLANS